MDLAAIRRRVEETSAGPWSRHGADVRSPGLEAPLFQGRDGTPEIRRQADADAEFVAHAREDVLALLQALEDAAARADAEAPTP